MKPHGEIERQTLAPDSPVNVPDGQRVEIDIRYVDDVIEMARGIRNRLENQWGGKLNRFSE